MAHAAADGLLLWYKNLLPALLPFSIFSNIIVRVGLFDACFFYPLLAGFIFGFPMGSKICADLWQENRFTRAQAERICCISNNFGPAFVCNYVAGQIPENPFSLWILMSAAYLPPLFCGAIWSLQKNTGILLHNQKQRFAHRTHKTPAPRFKVSFQIIDAGIMDGFTTMIKLAGYIMLFAILSDFLQTLPLRIHWIRAMLAGCMEITNGIHAISMSGLSPELCTIADVFLLHFGGGCGIFQTASMMRSVGMRLRIYLCFKLTCALIGTGMILLFSLEFFRF